MEEKKRKRLSKDPHFKEVEAVQSYIRLVFSHFDATQSGKIDNPRFRKVLLTCQLIPEALAINEVDIIYSASKATYQKS